MATWPASLPQTPLQRGYTETTPDTLIRTSMDKGPDKVRRRTTAGVRKFSFIMLLTADQVDTLETFYNDTTNGGADKFTFDHPRTSVSSDNFRFTGPPEYSAVSGGLYEAALGMELLPQ